jgi:hypothetical protein
VLRFGTGQHGEQPSDVAGRGAVPVERAAAVQRRVGAAAPPPAPASRCACSCIGLRSGTQPIGQGRCCLAPARRPAMPSCNCVFSLRCILAEPSTPAAHGARLLLTWPRAIKVVLTTLGVPRRRRRLILPLGQGHRQLRLTGQPTCDTCPFPRTPAPPPAQRRLRAGICDVGSWPCMLQHAVIARWHLAAMGALRTPASGGLPARKHCRPRRAGYSLRRRACMHRQCGDAGTLHVAASGSVAEGIVNEPDGLSGAARRRSCGTLLSQCRAPRGHSEISAAATE